ncbi:MAG: SUF system Fe-S cluster assembly regulator [Calditrichaeota bacterium]|nr:SUF system Fe-S cluster assembly regulator [Candidatus Cloacimonadota bacterium]MCA9787739.1 SUF system Fe-S cluster assembly regulator [Candidatus Cloacimonadota bacterium]MCB1048047.1 SUF system Fe-S cluster assembly regulator [Calditrichota bacterium]MCB9475147.1 SUF system Fe-S cluster assembly regulator [Candidatus Delongbacteria bacterium]
MLRISRQTDYGVFLMTIFGREEVGKLISARDLVARTQLPLPMVSKILKGLARNGILESQRGVHGGYYLSRPADQLSVSEIIEAIDGPIAITECVDEETGCRFKSVCPMHSNWSRINMAIASALSDVTLAQMCDWDRPMPRLNLGKAFGNGSIGNGRTAAAPLSDGSQQEPNS